MTWVWINGHRYYRRSRRVNGRVVTEHVGRGRVAELAARLDAETRTLRRLDAASERLERDALLIGVQDVLAVDEVLGDLCAILAGRCGVYRHRREWRRARGTDVMASLKGILGDVRQIRAELDKSRANPPLLQPEFDGVPDADRAVLQAAAKGDKGALAKAGPYLSDRAFTARWGSPMFAARCWLISQACGDDHLVARATHRQAEAVADDLGFQGANVLERLAITRVVHNWLTVGVLEVRACEWKPFSKERGQIDRCLTRAERRLMQAIKALAFLRREPAAAIAGHLPASVSTVRVPAAGVSSAPAEG